jgi:hypothetical protein
VKLPVVFSSNMVLQRAPMAARIWGWTASPHTRVTVSLSGGSTQSHSATSDASGSWLINLTPVATGAQVSVTVSDVRHPLFLVQLIVT